MIIKPQEKENIRNTYLDYRKSGIGKEESKRRTAADLGLGRTTVWDHVSELDDPNYVPKTKPTLDLKAGWPKKYILTSWELRVGIDKKFVETLQVMADYYDAELLLVPCQESDVNYLPSALTDVFKVVTENFKFNDNLMLRYVETNALLQSPISGHKGAYPDTSTILPGLVKELQTETSQNYVKQIMSTGSVGYLNARAKDYSEVTEDPDFNKKWKSIGTRRHGKPTAIAQNYVVPSALIVEVLDKKTFLTRFVTSFKGGTVCDLGLKFSPTGVEDNTPKALFVGDTHACVADRPAIDATLDMIKTLSPEQVVLNDFYDGNSVNHHEIADPIKFMNVLSVRQEAEITKALLKEFTDVSKKVIYLNSNHDNFLTRWLSGPTQMWRLHRNYTDAVELQLYRATTGKHPIIKLLDLESFPNVRFIPESASYYIGKVLIRHGHEGISGVRAGFTTLAKTYNYYVQGHLHSPAVFRNAAMAGLTAQLEQSYTLGASSWLHANVLIQPDNSLQLLPIIRGTWKG